MCEGEEEKRGFLQHDELGFPTRAGCSQGKELFTSLWWAGNHSRHVTNQILISAKESSDGLRDFDAMQMCLYIAAIRTLILIFSS